MQITPSRSGSNRRAVGRPAAAEPAPPTAPPAAPPIVPPIVPPGRRSGGASSGSCRRPGAGPSGCTAARVAGLRAGGMSPTAIRRALGLSAAQALACGLADPVLAPAVRPADAGAGPPAARDGRGPRLEAVAEAVAQACDLPRARLFGPAQDRRSARARHLLMYLLRELCAGASFPTIGFFLNRDHTTVIYGVRRIARELARDEALRALHARLRRVLSASR